MSSAVDTADEKESKQQERERADAPPTPPSASPSSSVNAAQFIGAGVKVLFRSLAGAVLSRAALIARFQMKSYLANFTHLRLTHVGELLMKHRWQEAIARGFLLNVASRVVHLVPDVSRFCLWWRYGGGASPVAGNKHLSGEEAAEAASSQSFFGTASASGAVSKIPLHWTLRIGLDLGLIAAASVATAPLKCLTTIEGLDISNGYGSMNAIIKALAASGEMIWVKTQPVARNPWQKPPTPPESGYFVRRALFIGVWPSVATNVVLGLAAHRLWTEFLVESVLRRRVLAWRQRTISDRTSLWLRRGLQVTAITAASLLTIAWLDRSDLQQTQAVRYSTKDKAVAGARTVVGFTALHIAANVVQYFPLEL